MNQSGLISRARLGVILSFLTHGFISSSFFARIPDYKARLELSNSVLGLCLLASSAGVLAALGPVGRLAAQRGSSAVLTKSSYLLVFIAPFVGISFNAISFAAILFLFGVAIAAQDVAMNTHGVTLEQKSGARYMGRFHAFWSVGALLGAITGGVFAQLEVSEFIHALIVSAAVLALVISNNRRYLPGNEDKHIYEESVKRKKTPRLIYIMGLLGLAGSIGEGSAADWGGVLARETFGASQFVGTLPYIAYSFTMVVGRFYGDQLATKFGARRILKVGGLLGGAGLAGGLIIGGTTGVIVGWFLFGLALSTVIPLLFSAAGSMANKRFQGTISPAEAVAKISGISYFGFVVGPPLMGFLADVLTLRWAMLVPAVLAVIISASSRIFRSE
jgi:MFS family permease